MADKTVVVRAVYRSNVAQGARQDAGAISSFSASVESAATKSVSSISKLGAASAMAGKLMVLGIGGALAVSAKAAIDFETSMAGVAKTTDLAGNSFDRNSGPLFQFGEALRAMSLRIPVNVNDLARIAELGGQLGIETDSLVEFTEVIAKLGVTTNMSAEEAADGFARFANIMRTPETEFEKLGSIVVELGNNLAATESEILHFATRIAPVGRTVGATEEEIFALAGALSSLGIPAERGGTAVQKWFITAKEAVDTSNASLATFADTAQMTSEEFQTLFRQDPGRAFEAFVQGLDKINQSGGDVFGTLESLQLSEVRTTQVLLAAAGGVDVLSEALDLAAEEGREVNALNIEAARRFGTTASAITLLGNSFNDLRIEIGNALLSSGGLAFAIDVLREFFAIIKDNLGTLETFVTIAGILVTLRLGVFFLQAAQNAQASVTAFRNSAAAAQQVAMTSRLAQGGMLALTAAMQGILGIAGLVAAVWMTQAVNAAQLKAEIKGLQQQIEQGADAFDVLVGAVGDILPPDVIEKLNAAGISVEDFTRFLMDNRLEANNWRTVIEEGLGVTIDGFIDFNKHIKPAQNLLEGFNDVLVNDLVNAFIETGNAAGYTGDQIRQAAENAVDWMGGNITPGQFLDQIERFMSGEKRFMFIGPEEGERFNRTTQGMEDDLKSLGKAWEMFLDPTAREGMVEDFFDDNAKAVEDFRKKMDDEFNAIGETIRDGFPVWEEYKQVVLGTEEALSPREVLASQERFLEDTRDFVERMPDIMEMGASPDVVSWLDAMETPIRGAISRLNDAQLQELIDGANANFNELQALHTQRWMQIYPENANLAFSAMVGELAGRVQEMNLPGEQSGEAFMAGLMDIMAQLPEEDQAQFALYLSGVFPDKQWLGENGIILGDGILGGLLSSISGWPLALQAEVIKAINAGIKTPIEDSFDIRSPSRWAYKKADLIGEGFRMGLHDSLTGMGKFFEPRALFPALATGSGPVSNVSNSRSSTYNLTVNSGAAGNNIRAESQTLLTLLTIVGGVETGAGR